MADHEPEKNDRESKPDDSTETAPATSGHSDADSQAKRNQEDESPA